MSSAKLQTSVAGLSSCDKYSDTPLAVEIVNANFFWLSLTPNAYSPYGPDYVHIITALLASAITGASCLLFITLM